MKAELPMRMAVLALLVPGLLALGACSEKKQAAGNGASAFGEVLPGSASDAMLPEDTVRSQPPLAPKSEPSSSAKGGKARSSDKPAAEVSDTSSAEPAPEAPAAAPEQAPAPEN